MQEITIPPYGGYSIELTKSYLFVAVTEDGNLVAKSLSELEQMINAHIKLLASMGREKTDIAAMDETGARYRITGVHAGNGNITTRPRLPSSYTLVYADTPHSREALADFTLARDNLAKATKVLWAFKIQSSYSAKDHSTCVALLRSAAAKAEKGEIVK